MAVRIVINHAAVREILRSRRVLDDLARRAQRVAEHAGPGYRVETQIGPNRARAAVVTATTAARVSEAHHRSLTRALDAAR